MRRIAWFAPSPSTSIGFAGHDDKLADRLERRHAVEWFCGKEHPDSPRFSSAHNFVWKHLRHPFDLTVYEVADAELSTFVWPYLVRHPGLVLLHDGRLHESRGGALLKQVRISDYRAEFRYNHPETSDEIPRLAHAELLGITRELWPMRRVVVESSRLLLAPSAWVADELRQEASHDRIEVVEPGVRPPFDPNDMDEEATSARVRQRYGFSSGDVLFAVIGDDSNRNRIPQIKAAFAHVTGPGHNAKLLLCGAPSEDQEGHTQDAHVARTGPLDHGEVVEHLVASDVCVCLQWPDRSDGTRTWITALAAAKPTIIVDLAHRVDVPSFDPRDWQPRRLASSSPAPQTSVPDPACVGIDIVDEEHSLRLAFRRLAEDRDLRRRLGERARELWSTRFSADRLVDDIDHAVTRALSVPIEAVDRPDYPAHLLDDGTGDTVSRLESLGLPPELPDLDL